MKLCPRCGTEKETTEFAKSAKNCTGLQGFCRVCMNLAAERSKYKTLYGITPEIYNEMFAKQEGCCAICLQHQNNFKRKLAVDHCHTTGKVRGLLCTNCNTAIGKLNDDLERIARAASYIRSQN